MSFTSTVSLSGPCDQKVASLQPGLVEEGSITATQSRSASQDAGKDHLLSHGDRVTHCGPPPALGTKGLRAKCTPMTATWLLPWSNFHIFLINPLTRCFLP